jgi:steroid delta-isomerase-like uncharacterized protein
MEANKALFRQVMDEFFGQHDMSAVDRHYSPDYIQHNADVAAWAKSQGLAPLDGVKRFFSGFFEAFPDFKPTIDHLYAEGDKVFAFVTWRGTHKGTFLGVPATGKEIVIRTAEIMRVENGKFAEHWDVVDQNKMLEALGLIQMVQPRPE